MPLTGALSYRYDSARLPLTLSLEPLSKTIGVVYKYSSTGQALWSAQISASVTGPAQTRGGLDRATCVYGTATDSTGAVYATGEWDVEPDNSERSPGPVISFYNSDGSYGGGLFGRVAGGQRLVFLVKYNAGGRFLWAANVLASLAEVRSAGRAVAVDPFDNVYMCGSVASASTTPVVTAYNANGTAFATTFTAVGNDPFLVKYDPSGTVQWLTRVHNTASGIATSETATGVAVNSSAVYMTGVSGGTAVAFNADGTSGNSFTGAGNDAFIAAYTLSGTSQWLARVSSTQSEVGYAAALDGSGSLLVVGTFAHDASAYNANGTVGGLGLSRSVGGDTGFLVKYSPTGTVQWYTRIGGNLSVPYAVCTDRANNVYVAGMWSPSAPPQVMTASAAVGSGGTAITQSSVGGSEAYIAKYNSAGAPQWLAGVVGSATESGYGVTTDASNNVYMLTTTTGTPTYTVTVRNAGGSTYSTETLTAGSNTTLLTQYTANGTAQWVRQLPHARTYALSSDRGANLYIGGVTRMYDARRAPGPSASVALTLANTGATDAIIVKYTTNGAPLWAARIASTGTDIAYATTTDPTGMIYVTGSVGAATATVYNANGTTFATTIPASRGFLVKYSLDGVVQWVVTFTANGGLGGRGVKVDSTGAVYVAASAVPTSSQFIAYNADGTAGITQSTLTSTSAGALLLKYSSAGTAQWISRLVSTNPCEYSAIALGPSDTIVVTGASQSGATAYNADGTSFGTITNDGGSDAIVVKYTSGGTIQWIARIASTTTDTAEAVVCDPSGAIYVGAFGANSSQAVTVFNADGTSFSTQPLPTSLALGDGYIVKYSSTGGAQWCARYASAGSDRPKGMALDSDGNLYFVGEASRPIFYNADGTSNRGTLMTAQGQMGFLAKYTSAGVCMWSFGFDATGNDITYAVATDRRNNVYVGGLHNTSGGNGTLLDIDYRAVLYPGPWNAMKFTSHGLLQWFQTLRGTTVFATVYGVAIDFDCNLIVVGSGPTGETLNIYARA